MRAAVPAVTSPVGLSFASSFTPIPFGRPLGQVRRFHVAAADSKHDEHAAWPHSPGPLREARQFSLHSWSLLPVAPESRPDLNSGLSFRGSSRGWIRARSEVSCMGLPEGAAMPIASHSHGSMPSIIGAIRARSRVSAPIPSTVAIRNKVAPRGLLRPAMIGPKRLRPKPMRHSATRNEIPRSAHNRRMLAPICFIAAACRCCLTVSSPVTSARKKNPSQGRICCISAAERSSSAQSVLSPTGRAVSLQLSPSARTPCRSVNTISAAHGYAGLESLRQ